VEVKGVRGRDGATGSGKGDWTPTGKEEGIKTHREMAI
jgi:hypothetical protein